MMAAVGRASLMPSTHNESQGLPNTGYQLEERETQLAPTPQGLTLNTAASPGLFWMQRTCSQLMNAAALHDRGNRWTTNGYFKPYSNARDQTVTLPVTTTGQQGITTCNTALETMGSIRH